MATPLPRLPKLSHFKRNTTNEHKEHLEQRVDLADPAFQPFDELSLDDLLHFAGEALRRHLAAFDTILAKKLDEETRTTLLEM